MIQINLEKKKIFLYTLHLTGQKKVYYLLVLEKIKLCCASRSRFKNFYLISEEKKKLEMNIKLNHDFVLTNIGAMTQNKGVEVLIAAYGMLKKKIKILNLF